MTSTSTDRIEGLTTSVAIKAPVRVATTANITLSGTQTIDGVAVVAEDRVLVKNQTTTTQNGIYTVSASTWSRSSDCDGSRDLALGTLVYIRSGTANGGKIFRQTTSGTGGQTTIIFDTDSPAFSEADIFTPQTGSFDFTFDSSTSMADPGAGDFRLDNATVSSVTNIAFSDTDADSSDVSAWVLTFDDGASSGVRGTIILKDRATPTNFAIFNVTGAVTDNSGWTQIPVTYVTGSGSFTAGNRTTLGFARAGSVNVTISAFAETLLDDADAAAARVTLGNVIVLTDVTAAGLQYTSGQYGAVTTLTDSSTITLNFNSTMGNAARVTLGGNRQFVASNLPTSGFRFPFGLEIRQDNTGGRTASWSSDFVFNSSQVPTLSTSSGAFDYLPMYAESSAVRVGNITKNFRSAT